MSIAGEFGGDISVTCRLVIDYSAVNAYIELYLHPVPLLQEQGAVLAGYPFPMSLDIYKGGFVANPAACIFPRGCSR